MRLTYAYGALSETGKEKINSALAKAYDYFTRVIIAQQRFLDNDELVSSYYSMHFKEELAENILINLLNEMRKAIR